MQGNTAVRTEPPRRDRRMPGVTPIAAAELEILDQLAPGTEELARILTVKAVLGGEICGWYREEGA